MSTPAKPGFSPLSSPRLAPQDAVACAQAFLDTMRTRRTVRDFSPAPLPEGVLDLALAAANTAPSGANRQPWRFVVVTDATVKSRIRAAAEAEEREFYERRATPEWLEDLAPLGTDAHKPFLEVAPALIVVFKQDYALEAGPDGAEVQRKNYYV